MDAGSELFGCADGVFRQTGVGERRNCVGTGEREASDLERGLKKKKMTRLQRAEKYEIVSSTMSTHLTGRDTETVDGDVI